MSGDWPEELSGEPVRRSVAKAEDPAHLTDVGFSPDALLLPPRGRQVRTMEERSFGQGVHVSVLGFGCGRVGSLTNTVPMSEIEATLDAAIDAGINLFDTADIYAQGDSERALSRMLQRHRERMFVVTKVGGRHSRYSTAIRLAKPLLRVLVRSRPQVHKAFVQAREAAVTYNFRPEDLRIAVEASRRRLRLDQLDGLLLHGPSLATLRDPAVHDFLAELQRTGKAAHVGVSVETPPDVEAALAISALSIIQVPVPVACSLAEPAGAAMVEQIRQRKIGVFVREILEGVRLGTLSPREAIWNALAPDFITAAIIGVSTRRHLNEALSAVT
jgi:aryl-alcohol dehydrogenase-like predicted oxidoreductase